MRARRSGDRGLPIPSAVLEARRSEKNAMSANVRLLESTAAVLAEDGRMRRDGRERRGFTQPQHDDVRSCASGDASCAAT